MPRQALLRGGCWYQQTNTTSTRMVRSNERDLPGEREEQRQGSSDRIGKCRAMSMSLRPAHTLMNQPAKERSQESKYSSVSFMSIRYKHNYVAYQAVQS